MVSLKNENANPSVLISLIFPIIIDSFLSAANAFSFVRCRIYLLRSIDIYMRFYTDQKQQIRKSSLIAYRLKLDVKILRQQIDLQIMKN